MSNKDQNPDDSEEKEEEETENLEQKYRQQFADAFDRDLDPLEEYSETFEGLPDPFEYFIEMVITSRDRIGSDHTVEEYHRTYRQWREFMNSFDRHPACPNKQQIKSFVHWRLDVFNNAPATVKARLSRLNQAYRYWQEEHAFPHPKSYNPYDAVRGEIEYGEYETETFPDLTLETLQDRFAAIENIRSRAIIGAQLKLGIRSGELRNLRIEDIHLSHSGVQQCYPDLGTHPGVSGYQNAVVIPPDREGNKSVVTRMVPVDDELRWLLIRHLLTRPQVDEPWVFLSTQSFSKLATNDPVNKPWKDAFHPEYDGSSGERPITSHFGRHWFSSYLRVSMKLERELVQYLRGDNIEPEDGRKEAIDDYIHPKYEDIEADYRDDIFKLNIPMKHYSA